MSEWTIIDHDNNNEKTASSRAEAEKKKQTAKEFGSENVEIVPPSKSDGGVEVVKSEAKPVEDTELPERKVTDDPFEWLPGHYVDQIDGSPAINRQGYAVLSQFYDINVVSDVQVGPEETGFEYCRCEATAYDSEGNEYRANGSAHVERGDDAELLLEMADTRATKRVLAIATGVGAVAVEELKNEL